MDNAQIVSEIRSRVGQNSGLSDLTITSLVTPLIPADGNPDQGFFDRTAEWLKTLGGNFSHDVAAQVNSQVEAKANEKFEAFKRDYKPDVKTVDDIYKLLGVEKPGEQAPKTIDELILKIQGQQANPAADQQNQLLAEVLKAIKEERKPDPAIAQMQQQLKDLIDENNRIKAQNAFDAVVKAVGGKADELKVLNTALWNHSIEVATTGVDRATLTEDKLLELTKAKYEELSKLLSPPGSKPYGESQPGGGNSPLASILAKKDAANRAKQEAIEAQRKGWK